MLHLGGVGTAGVESLSFALPEEWAGMAVTLHIEQDGGTLPQPVLLDESRTVTVDHRFTAARQGLWMLLALALINQILSAAGKPLLPIDSAQIEQLISTGFTTVSALVNWWFNNSFTKEALAADEEYQRLKKSVH